MERSILHCDCNSFFASVELLRHPELRDVPVAVCGDPARRHGIILAKNEPAKKFHIQTAETVQSALRKCPQLTLLPPHHEMYREYSARVNAIYARYTDRVEPFGIDESWLDVSGTYHLFAESPAALAHKIRCEVTQETGLTISVGVSFNKVFAKLGSDYKKPDAVTEITRENMRAVVWPLPAESLLYVGKSARQTLTQMGIYTIGQLAAVHTEMLTARLGKLGADLSRYARGEDTAPVLRQSERPAVKSVGNGLTFTRNLRGAEDVRAGVGSLADEVAARLRKHGLYCHAVQVAIKDTELKTIQRQKQLRAPSHLAKEIAQAAFELVRDNWAWQAPIRMLTVTAIQLTDSYHCQLDFFRRGEEGADKKRESLEQSLDSIRAKYGKNAIAPAYALHNDIGIDDIVMDT